MGYPTKEQAKAILESTQAVRSLMHPDGGCSDTAVILLSGKALEATVGNAHFSEEKLKEAYKTGQEAGREAYLSECFGNAVCFGDVRGAANRAQAGEKFFHEELIAFDALKLRHIAEYKVTNNGQLMHI